MNFSNPIQLIVSRKTLQQTRNFKFNYKSPIEELEKLAKVLQIEKLKSLSFKGRIFQSSRDNYIFQTSMQANLVQLCVISLSPMKVKINHDITQYFSTKVAESAGAAASGSAEIGRGSVDAGRARLKRR